MSDRFHPLSMEQLTDWVFTELEQKGSLFNVPRPAFFVPRPDHRFRRREYGVELETPFGVAAGPHTQMAQNIIVAWLVGARLIELKTVQTLDELEVHKPCIDVQDEGYNVEWSQELKVHQSFDEYLRAWVLVHALHRWLGFPGERPGVLFNMSVGYNLEGILPPERAVVPRRDGRRLARTCPATSTSSRGATRRSARSTSPPASPTRSRSRRCTAARPTRSRGSPGTCSRSAACTPRSSATRRCWAPSGCEASSTTTSASPTCRSRTRRSVTTCKYADAVPMFGRLREAADARGLTFGLKLSNTLEVENWRTAFDRDPTMYLSGRPLHAVTVNLAATLAGDLGGDLPLSFAGGADCFNVADLLGAGIRTVTVCSDLLKSGGYLRMLQYPEHVDAAFDAAGATDTGDFIRRTAQAAGYAGDAGSDAGSSRLRAVQPAPLRRRRPR